MQAITQDIATFLRLSDGANTVINLEHDDSEFAHTLIEALRREGIGVSQGNPMDYLNLRYRVEKFNERQFFVSATLSDGRTLSRIWVLNNNALIPLKTRAYGVNNE
ncbi:hypothetical protein JCM19232_4985 [Vibrio ishigakensis]|uniref:Uncharacterized protein n=1 Tax=Vibrio ishigakensis TaxID=1481914 RepID=A0A0B8PEX6_9VIBR|nr:hypothetical protein JCM19232_4985 [Vibrio ishigakensis]